MSNQNGYSDSKRVAKNTILLYLRMLVMTLIGLLTTRYVLKALGVEDLGIYNVVGGVVGILTFLNSAMASASTRFISVALTTNDIKEQRKVFSTTFMLHFYLSMIILVLLETVGLWIVNNVLVIPVERLYAANVVYQFSVFSCILSIWLVPYSAALISHEKMYAYAYFSIFDIIFRLVLTIAVCNYNGDRLILYGAFLLFAFLVTYIINLVYCIRKIEECSHLAFTIDKVCAKSISRYLGWSMYTNTAHVFTIQGLNILLNIFFGPAVNASRQIAGSVQSKLMTFADLFQMAINPQIIKTYAVGAFKDVFKLVYQSERITFYMLSVLMIPVLLTTKDILYIWLGQVPQYSDVFCQLILMMSFINALANPFMKIIQADGRLKRNSLYTGTSIFLILPLSYISLKWGLDAPIVYVVNLIIYVLAYFIRIKIVYDLYHFDVWNYFKACVFKPSLVVSVPAIIAVVVSLSIEHSIINVIAFDFVVVVVILLFVYLFGLENNEKDFVNKKVLSFINRNK